LTDIVDNKYDKIKSKEDYMISGNSTSNSAKTISPREKTGRRRIISGRLVSILVAALFLGTLAFTAGGCANATTSGPRIQFDRDVIDLGTVAPGDELEVVFVFRNNGNETLIIDEITTESLTQGC
jgi:hypothetical protein